MSETGQNLRPADPDDLKQALAYALRFAGRRRSRSADDVMARITAERIAEHLERAGYVVLKRPPVPGSVGPS